jgi:hypothetical protein
MTIYLIKSLTLLWQWQSGPAFSEVSPYQVLVSFFFFLTGNSAIINSLEPQDHHPTRHEHYTEHRVHPNFVDFIWKTDFF